MLLQPVGDRLTRGAKARIKTLPVPLKGWNSREKYAETTHSQYYAPILTNFFINKGRAELVAGYTTHCTGLPVLDVESLFEYSGGGTSKIFAALGSEIYNVTNTGAVGAADVTGLTNARFQHTMFATTSGQYLCIINGADDFRTYDGSSWAVRSITGVSAANLINIASHKARLWFVQKNTLKAWYLATEAISGTANQLNLAPLCKHGGTLAAIGSWTNDGGAGPDDFMVFVTSEGELLVYHGIDPAATFTLVGVYKVDRPIGSRCIEKYGADLVILTESGVVQMSKVLASIAGEDSFSDEVRDDFVVAATGAGRNFYGWELQLYPSRGWLIANVPQTTAGVYHQFVYNTVTPGWFRMTKPAICWHATETKVLFGGKNGTVFRADYGTSDNGTAITGELQFAWSRFGTSNRKRFTQARVHYFSDGAPRPFIDIKVDYDESAPILQPTPAISLTGAEWDSEEWDVGIWGGGTMSSSRWMTARGVGTVGAPRLKVTTAVATFAVVNVDVAFEVGGVL